MREKIIEEKFEATEFFDQLEGHARGEIQRWMQTLLEEEVTSMLGRVKSGRKASVDSAPGYRNGFGKVRRFSMNGGTIEVKRPRVRGLEARFESRVLPLFRRRTKEVGELLPQLYLYGLSQGTSISRCAGSWAMARRCRDRQSSGCVARGRNDRSKGLSRCTSGPVGSMSRRAWRRKKRLCWW